MIINVTIIDKVNITDSASHNTKFVNVQDFLFITDSVVSRVIFAEVSDTITITEKLRTYPSVAGDRLNITDQVTVVEQSKSATISDSIFITDSVVSSGSQIVRKVFDIVHVSDKVYRHITTQSATNSLTITDSVHQLIECIDTIVIKDHVTYTKTPGVSDKINIVDSVTPSIIRAFVPVADTVTISDGVGYQLILSQQTRITILSCPQTKTYSPNISGGNSKYTPPSTVQPVTSRQPHIVLTWPFASPTQTITIKNPEFNNLDKRTYRRIVRHTRGGELKIFRNPIWPVYKRLNYTIHMVHEEDANALLQFFRLSLGQQIGLVDFENRHWQGIIITPEATVNYEVARVRAIQFEFEGDLI